MKITAQFYYGINYASPDGKDVEHFDSLKEAKEAFWRRNDFDPYFPCVENPEMVIWKGHLKDVTDIYPDEAYTIGKRGGIVRQAC